MSTLTEKQKADCLAYDPFAGDFGDQGDKPLIDKIVKTRKAGECNKCTQQIVPGTEIRSRTDRADGAIMSFRWCHDCCVAMATSWEDDGEAIEARHALRHAAQ
jgi:hypothetical protein